MSDEEVLNTFFDLLETEQQSKGFKSIKEVFTDQEKAKIDLKELISGLNKIGIKETDSTVDIIEKKFKDYFSSDLININGLISNYELYLEEKKKKSIPKPNFSFNPNHSNYSENLAEPRDSPFSPPKELKKDEEVKSNSSKKDEEVKSNSSKKVEDKVKSANGTPITESVVIKDEVNKNLDRFSFRDPNLMNQENKQEIQEEKSKNTKTPSFLTHSTNPLERIENVNNRLMQDLSENTNFKLLDIYELFATLVRRTGLMLEQTFTMKDIRKDKFLAQIEYNIVFKSFNLNFTEEQKIVIFQDLPQKDDGRLNYRYFLDKIYKYDPIDKFKFIRNYNHLYNDYINFLRKFIRDNQINVSDIWKKNFQERDINKDEFKRLLKEINFNFYEPIEIENIFNLLNDNGKIKLTELINVLMLDPLDVKSSVMSANKMSSWKDKIILFDAAKANEYKKSFTHLIKVFDEIRKRLIKEKIEDLFNSIFVTIDGECDEMDFIHIMGKYNVGKSSYFINFLEFFKNKKSKRFEVITFINAYNSIYFEGGESIPTDVSVDKNLNLSKTLIQEKQPQAAVTQEASKTAPSNFNNKNDRGVSDDDLEYIKDVVNFIEPIISNEKRKSVIEFFKGYDKQRVGYFSKDIFMKILDDLEVDTQGGDEINVKKW